MRRKREKPIKPTLRHRVVASKMELARWFYWCDELSFFKMRTPINEVMAFVNYTYREPEDDLIDVPNFFARIHSAQRHGKAYIRGRFQCLLKVEDPEDAPEGWDF